MCGFYLGQFYALGTIATALVNWVRLHANQKMYFQPRKFLGTKNLQNISIYYRSLSIPDKIDDLNINYGKSMNSDIRQICSLMSGKTSFTKPKISFSINFFRFFKKISELFNSRRGDLYICILLLIRKICQRLYTRGIYWFTIII